MRISSAVVAMFSSIFFSSAALAATVNVTNGQVLVNKGEGYRQVAGSTQANPGASVVANPGGSGQVVYSDQCIVEVLPGSVYNVAEQSPCATGLFTPGSFAIGAVIVGGGVGAFFLLKDKSSSP